MVIFHDKQTSFIFYILIWFSCFFKDWISVVEVLIRAFKFRCFVVFLEYLFIKSAIFFIHYNSVIFCQVMSEDVVFLLLKYDLKVSNMFYGYQNLSYSVFQSKQSKHFYLSVMLKIDSYVFYKGINFRTSAYISLVLNFDIIKCF